MRVVLLVLPLVVAPISACTKNDSVVAETLVPPPPRPSASVAKVDAPPAPPEPPRAPVAPPDGPPQPLSFAPTESAAPKLGAACGADRAACGTKGRVAVRAYRERGFVHPKDRPCSPVSTAQAEAAVHEVPSACVAGDRLYVETSCIVCRMPVGSVVEATVSELTAEQRASLVALVGVDARSNPGTSAEWAAAIGEAHKRAPSAMP